jgi:hypothetical protein
MSDNKNSNCKNYFIISEMIRERYYNLKNENEALKIEIFRLNNLLKAFEKKD